MEKEHTKRRRATGSTVVVNICETPWGPFVDMEPVYIGVNDEIQWQAASGADFAVDFNAPGPFKGKSFNKANPRSGKPNVNGNPHKTYKYSVTVNGVKIDPGVIVH